MLNSQKEQRSRFRLHGVKLMAFQLKAHRRLTTFLAERGVGAGFGGHPEGVGRDPASGVRGPRPGLE